MTKFLKYYFDFYFPVGTHLLNLRLAKVDFADSFKFILHFDWIDIYADYSDNWKNFTLLKIKKRKKDYNNEI